MVLLSLGSGLITALMAQAKPAHGLRDWSWIADAQAAPDRSDDDHAVTAPEKPSFSQ